MALVRFCDLLSPSCQYVLAQCKAVITDALLVICRKHSQQQHQHSSSNRMGCKTLQQTSRSKAKQVCSMTLAGICLLPACKEILLLPIIQARVSDSSQIKYLVCQATQLLTSQDGHAQRQAVLNACRVAGKRAAPPSTDSFLVPETQAAAAEEARPKKKKTKRT